MSFSGARIIKIPLESGSTIQFERRTLPLSNFPELGPYAFTSGRQVWNVIVDEKIMSRIEGFQVDQVPQVWKRMAEMMPQIQICKFNQFS